MGRGRRGVSKVVRVPSEDVVSQGPGTWVELWKRLRFPHLQPVIQLAAWREDPRVLGQEGPEEQAEAITEMLDSFGKAIYRVITNWNWLTDMEGELVDAPKQAQGDVLSAQVHLQGPIWAGSEFCTLQDGRVGAPEFVWGAQPVYLGQFPDNCQRMALEGVKDDGCTLIVRGELEREYVPGDDYVLVGLPDPVSPQAFAWSSLDEIMWLITTLAERFQEEMERRRSRPKAARG